MVISEAGLEGNPQTTGLSGCGVGTTVYSGIARLANSPEEAVQLLGPGKVLVVPCTTPAYNMVIGMAGALVTSEGGAPSHAAVIARTRPARRHRRTPCNARHPRRPAHRSRRPQGVNPYSPSAALGFTFRCARLYFPLRSASAYTSMPPRGRCVSDTFT
jgi:hypothetical protein